MVNPPGLLDADHQDQDRSHQQLHLPALPASLDYPSGQVPDRLMDRRQSHLTGV